MKPGTPIGKLARRLGVTPTEKSRKIIQRRPELEGRRRRGKRSVYGAQLLEKQKLRFQFMISEKALRRAFKRAKAMRGESGTNLIQILDQRLDATIFRSGVVRSVPAARQLVSHRHVLVNDTLVYSPSYQLRPGDVVRFSEKARQFAYLNEEVLNAQPPEYIQLDPEAKTITRLDTPSRKQIPVECSDQMVVEWYSR